MTAWTWLDLADDPDEEMVYLGDPAELVEAQDVVRALLYRPAWHGEAACRGGGPGAVVPGAGRRHCAGPGGVCRVQSPGGVPRVRHRPQRPLRYLGRYVGAGAGAGASSQSGGCRVTVYRMRVPRVVADEMMTGAAVEVAVPKLSGHGAAVWSSNDRSKQSWCRHVNMRTPPPVMTMPASSAPATSVCRCTRPTVLPGSDNARGTAF